MGYLPGPGGVWSWGGGGCLVPGGRGVSGPRGSGPGGSGPGGCLVLGGYLPGPGGAWSGNHHPPPLWTEFLTHACENITLAETLFRPVKTYMR